jgi:hypothetical protein
MIKGYKVQYSGMENPTKVLNRNGDVVAVVYTDNEPSDQYETAELLVRVLNSEDPEWQGLTAKDLPPDFSDEFLKGMRLAEALLRRRNTSEKTG